jgi:hypothetical protein
MLGRGVLGNYRAASAQGLTFSVRALAVSAATGAPAQSSRCRPAGSDDLTIKKLTRGNPTMAGKFAELKNAEPTDAE